MAEEAIVSIPYLVARTLADPGCADAPISQPFSIPPKIARLMGVITVHGEAGLADGAARIVVDGGARCASCDAARGTQARVLTVDETVDKFRQVSGLDEAERVVAAIMDEDMPLPAAIDLLG